MTNPKNTISATAADAFEVLMQDFKALKAKHPSLDIQPPSRAVFEAGWKAHEALRNSSLHEVYSDSDPVKPAQICDSNGQVVLSLCKICGQAEGDLDSHCPGKRVLKPIEHDCLPPVGTKVLIHLASSNSWVEHTVVGYYVWAPLASGKTGWRVFVRVIDQAGYENARSLDDVRWQGMPQAFLKHLQRLEAVK